MKHPLGLFIYWHQASEQALELAGKLYSYFLREPSDPLKRYLGIPTQLYPGIPGEESMDQSDFALSISIFLVDDCMVISEEWRRLAESLKDKLQHGEEGRHVILPIALTQNAFNLKPLRDLQFVRKFEIEDSIRSDLFCLIRISHELCRLLYGENANTNGAKPPVKLFLSHAKRDEEGERIAKALKLHISKNYGVDAFFDANDIRVGRAFYEEIRISIEESMILIFHTDSFSASEWCRKELLLAKKANRPLVVINQFEKGEFRSFPYMGNVPHFHYPLKMEQEEINPALLDYIVLEALREALKIQYLHLQVASQVAYFNKQVDEIFCYPPELVSITRLQDSSTKVVLYPDPPLGEIEHEVLHSVRSDLTYVTPTMLPMLSQEGEIDPALKNLKVGISLSESDVSEISWVENWAIQNLMVELTRYLLISGVQLIYSGTMDYKSRSKGEDLNFAMLLKRFDRDLFGHV